MKNKPSSFVAIVGTVAVMAVLLGFSTPRVLAYAIGSTSTFDGSGVSTSSGGVGTTSYDFGSSLQNLISPFTNFISSLHWSNNTSVNTNGTPGFTEPTFNATPTVENTIDQWWTDFNNWLYKNTGVQLSNIFYIILSALAWVLHLAEDGVNWLLGLFH